MSQEVNLSEIIKELQPYYRKLYSPLLKGRNYSLLELINRLNGWVHSRHWDSMDESSRHTYNEGLKSVIAKVDFFTGKIFYLLVSALDSLVDANIKLAPEKVNSFLNLLVRPLDTITEEAINRWFVDTARTVCKGELKAEIYDDYNIFKNKWNNALDEIENVCDRFGLDVRAEKRAKDLGVKVAP